MNGVDIEMARFQEVADRHSRLEARGICLHGHHRENSDDTITCLQCGKVMPYQEWEDFWNDHL
jgi:hypothetical protein